jgi:hypothetical protein
MRDAQLHDWLERQLEEGRALAAQSDRFDLVAMEDGESPPTRFVLDFCCTSLVRHSATGSISKCSRAGFGVWFHPEYLRVAKPMETMTVLGPAQLFHPNVRFPFVCLGRLQAGTPLVDIIYQSYEILTYQKFATHDALNPTACSWARRHPERFPVDDRPLKRLEESS